MPACFMWQSHAHQSRYKTLKRSELSLEVNCKKAERHDVAGLPGLVHCLQWGLESCLALDYIQLNSVFERPFMLALPEDCQYAHVIVLGTPNINKSVEHWFVTPSACGTLFYSRKPPWKLKIAVIKESPKGTYFFEYQRTEYFYFVCNWA